MDKVKAKEEKIEPKDDSAKVVSLPLKKGNSRYRVQFDIEYKGHKGEENDGESLTEPDMTLSIRQLLERHTRGGELPEKPPLYFDIEVPTINDITDVEAYREQLTERLEDVNQFIKDEAAEIKAAKEAEKAKQKELEEFRKRDTPNEGGEENPENQGQKSSKTDES